MRKVMIVLGLVVVLVSGMMVGCRKSGGEKSEAKSRGKESSPSSTTKKQSIDFFEEKEFLESEKSAPKKPEHVVLKWAQENIGEPGVLLKPSYDGRDRNGPKITENGELYIDVAGPEGPKVHVIDILSGKILRSKEIEPGYYLVGISQKAIYLAPFGSQRNIIDSVLVLDKGNWTRLWEKDLADFHSIRLTDKGILYTRRFKAGEKKVPLLPKYPNAGYQMVPQYKTETGLLNEVTGQLQPLWEPRDGGVPDIVSPLRFKGLSINSEPERIPHIIDGDIAGYTMTGREKYTVSVIDLSTGQVSSAKEGWYEGMFDSPRILGQCEDDGKFFVSVKESKYICITCIDISSAQIKWETEKLLDTDYTRIAGATKKVIVIYGQIAQRNIPYTLWYAIDAANGKILWKKWATIDYQKGIADPFFMGGGGVTEMAGEILLIWKGSYLVLVDALNGEIITQQEEFPMATWSGYAFYKDMFIIGVPNGLRAYQIKR